MIKIFEVINGGLLTTVQDLGRRGYQKYGLAVSGAADPYAHRMSNVLVRNKETAATLEVTLMGLKLKVLEPCLIAITGGNLNPHVNGEPAPMWASFPVNVGDDIHFKGCSAGCRAYIAVAGGFKVADVLGSKSTDLAGHMGGMDGRALKRGDVIDVYDANDVLSGPTRKRLASDLIPTYADNIKVRVVLGPQDDSFTEAGIRTFFSSTYTVTKDSDRMACRLEGPVIEHAESADINSEGMFFGAIQVPKNGLPILFQAGRPSVGGYTKIGGVITVDLPKVAQLKPSDKISFQQVTVEEAHVLLQEQERLFKLLQVSC